jgi:hypothetical protein
MWFPSVITYSSLQQGKKVMLTRAFTSEMVALKHTSNAPMFRDITIYGEFAYAAVVEFQSKKKKKHPDVPNEGITVIYQINKMGKVVNKLNITTETQIHKFYAQGNGLMALLNGELFQLNGVHRSGKIIS